MHRISPLIAVLVAALAGAQSAPPTEKEIRALVSQLGSDEFVERESAAKRLEELGESALSELRAGCKSENPEIVRRSQDLLRAIERRVQSQKRLTPTMVAIDAVDRPLDEVLADLSKQLKYEVVLNGPKIEELAKRTITVSTKGEVPFWTAMLKVNDAAGLQIACVGGFLAPDAAIDRTLVHFAQDRRLRVDPESSPKARIAKNLSQAIVLEPRSSKSRPAAVNGAVLVEALALPKGSEPAEPSILLQIWPEPRLQWQAASSVKVAATSGATNVKLMAEAAGAGRSPGTALPRGRLVAIRNADGTVRFTDEGAVPSTGSFKPNVRQVVLRLQAGEKTPDALQELRVTLFATVRSGFEPLSQAAGLELNKPAVGSGATGIELSAVYHQNENDRLVARVTASFDPQTVSPAGMSDDLPGAKSGSGLGNQSIYGLRVTDANGRPYTLGLVSGQHRVDPVKASATIQATLELHPDRGGIGPPAAVTLWGTSIRPVEVPVVLKDVPLTTPR